ncbi:MAG: geranylgeranylglycerol-phosphate geranylgeranyltransferase [Ferruginibacter sp.]
MKLFAAFLKLVRWPNLFFIVLTQCLFYFCVFSTVAAKPGYHHRYLLFTLLVAASVLIAAAGYIINDYFDLQIDKVNKPEKVVVDKIVKRRWAIMWHWVFSVAGMLLSLFISYKTGQWIIVSANIIAVLLLWFYSTSFKKKVLSGNIIISALSAWVLLVVYFFSGADIGKWPQGESLINFQRFFKFTSLYAGFAFITSLIREVVKDLEDMNGDMQYKCRTMPIEWGVPASKVFVAVWLIVSMAALFIIQLYAWQTGWWLAALYIVLAVILPMVFILAALKKAVSPPDYHKLSTSVKFVMLTGILSMLFFLFYR